MVRIRDTLLSQYARLRVEGSTDGAAHVAGCPSPSTDHVKDRALGEVRLGETG